MVGREKFLDGRHGRCKLMMYIPLEANPSSIHFTCHPPRTHRGLGCALYIHVNEQQFGCLNPPLGFFGASANSNSAGNTMFSCSSPCNTGERIAMLNPSSATLRPIPSARHPEPAGLHPPHPPRRSCRQQTKTLNSSESHHLDSNKCWNSTALRHLALLRLLQLAHSFSHSAPTSCRPNLGDSAAIALPRVDERRQYQNATCATRDNLPCHDTGIASVRVGHDLVTNFDTPQLM